MHDGSQPSTSTPAEMVCPHTLWMSAHHWPWAPGFAQPGSGAWITGAASDAAEAVPMAAGTASSTTRLRSALVVAAAGHTRG
ncbi:hypothetical protein A4E84_12940 [Streptomyces qaidamensis]|uniref:Uncharacterized protein n=1 Tax=Streptomyces qaidamensis TaxID=1783515 RepID=A0A143BZR7_9ACTN|nr:hypothetical protein A4E84_12940 [Streptomyces qaidamensis]